MYIVDLYRRVRQAHFIEGKSIRQEATRDGAPPIDLIGGDLLIEKLRELNLGVRTKMVETVEIDKEWFQSLS